MKASKRKRMIVVFGGDTGVGKSCNAQQICVLGAYRHKASPLLIETDKTKAASYKWIQRRQRQENVPVIVCERLYDIGSAFVEGINQLAAEYPDSNLVLDIVGSDDTGTLRSALGVADKAYFPLAPTQTKAQEIPLWERLVRSVKAELNPHLEAYFYISRAPTNPKIKPYTTELLLEHLHSRKNPAIGFTGRVIHERAAFLKSDLTGLGITELERPDPKAVGEIENLFNHIYHA